MVSIPPIKNVTLGIVDCCFTMSYPHSLIVCVLMTIRIHKDGCELLQLVVTGAEDRVPADPFGDYGEGAPPCRGVPKSWLSLPTKMVGFQANEIHIIWRSWPASVGYCNSWVKNGE